MTDVTGFGLLGHLIEMARRQRLKRRNFYNKIPVSRMASKTAIIKRRIFPDATTRNWNSYQ